MNRFDKPAQYDYSFDRYMPEYYMPNFAQWGQVIEKEKIQDEAAKELLEKYPAYIKSGEITYKDEITGEPITKQYGDEESNAAFRQRLSTLQDEMAEAAQTGDMQLYRQKRTEALREINRMWQPGGHAYELESRYKDFSEGMKKLKEQGEKSMDWETMNKDYATIKFLEKVGKHDYTIKNSQGVESPDIYPFQDILKDATEYAAKIGYNDATVEYNDETGAFIVRDRDKRVIPEAGELITKFINQEKYGKQFNINKFRYIQGIDMDALKEETQKANEKIRSLNQAETTLYKQTETIDKEDFAATKKLQQDLKNLGYNIDVDGVFGKQTEEAIGHFRENYSENRHKEYTPQELIAENITSNYRDIASGVFSKIRSITRRADPYYLADINYRNNQTLLKEQYEFQRLSVPVAVGQAETITVDDVNERATQATTSLKETQRTLTDKLTPLFGAFYKIGESGPNRGLYNLGSLFENLQQAWNNSGGEYGPFVRELNRIGINAQDVNVDNIINYISSGSFGDDYEQFNLAKSEQEESNALAQQTVRNAFNKWLDAGGKQWITSNTNYGDNYELFYRQHLEFKPNKQDPYGNAPWITRKVSGAFQWLGGVRDLGQEALKQMQGRGIYTPGEEVVAGSQDLGNKDKGYAEAAVNNFTKNINKGTLQGLPEVKAVIGEGSTISSARVKNTQVLITGTGYPVVEIEYKDAEGKTKHATVPVMPSKLFNNYEQDITNAQVADIIDKDANITATDEAALPIGRLAFKQLTRKPVISQNNASLQTQDLKIGDKSMQIGSSFQVVDPQTGQVSQFKILANRTRKGKDGVVYGIAVYNPTTKAYETTLKDFSNFKNVEQLQARFALEIKRRDPSVKELVKYRPASVGMQQNVQIPFTTVPVDNYEEPSTEE